MTSRTHRMGLIAMTLLIAMVSAALVPLCMMADCNNMATGSCSDFKPACDQCPDTVLMKHVRDEASSAMAFSLAEPMVVASVPDTAAPVLLQHVIIPVAPTASPPPRDPLGVRLTV